MVAVSTLLLANANIIFWYINSRSYERIFLDRISP